MSSHRRRVSVPASTTPTSACTTSYLDAFIGDPGEASATTESKPPQLRTKITSPKTANEQIKRTKVKHTCQQLSQLCIVGAVAVVVYYDFLLIWPHFAALFWATTWSVILARPRKVLLAIRLHLDRYSEPYKPYIIACIIPLYFVVVAIAQSNLSILSSTFGLGTFVFLLVGAPRTVVAVSLVILVMLLIAIPVAVVLKTSIDEVNDIFVCVHDFIADNDDVRKIFVDFGSSPIYRYAVRFAESWGAQLPAWDAEIVKQQAMALVTMAGGHVSKVLDVSMLLVNQTSNAILSFITFISFLFYLLSENSTTFHEGLSPFSDADTRMLLGSLKKSVVRTFVCSLITGMVHCFLTYLSFRLCGLQYTLILSTLSGLLSMMPFIGTWVIWVPVSLGFAATGSHVKSLAIAGIHLFGDLYVDTVIRSYIPGHSYFVGPSIAMGLYVFGFEGVFIGPLLTGLTMTLLDMYRDYTTAPGAISPTKPARTTSTILDNLLLEADDYPRL